MSKQPRIFVKRTGDMAVNTSGGLVEYKVEPGETEVLQITRVMLEIEATGTFLPNTWGNGLVLTNGIYIRVYQDGVIRNINEIPLKTTGNLAGLCYDVNYMDFGNPSAAKFLTARFTFEKLGGNIRLSGKTGDYIAITTQDDFSGLDAQYAYFEGHIENNLY